MAKVVVAKKKKPSLTPGRNEAELLLRMDHGSPRARDIALGHPIFHSAQGTLAKENSPRGVIPRAVSDRNSV